MPHPLILLPGLDGTGRLFRPLIEHLPDSVRPVVVSYPPGEPLGYAELLPIVLAALPAEQPFTILGESFSGPLAVMVADLRPPGLAALVLDATFVRNPVHDIARYLEPLARPLAERLGPGSAPVRWMLGLEDAATFRHELAEIARSVPPATMAHRIRAVLDVDAADALRRCAYPVLYLRGTRDRLVRRHNAELVARLAPDVRIVDIDSGHLVLQTRPRESVAAILAFLEQVVPEFPQG